MRSGKSSDLLKMFNSAPFLLIFWLVNFQHIGTDLSPRANPSQPYGRAQVDLGD